MNYVVRGGGNQFQWQWRLHPPSLANPPRRAAEAEANNGKYSFELNDDVYVRPKSARELGISGRIVDIYNAAAAAKGRASPSEGASPKRSKKRRLAAEDARVSLRRHRFDRNADDRNAPRDLRGAIKKGVRPSRLFPVYDARDDGEIGSKRTPPLVILTPDTTNYRRLACAHLRPSDKVLEIGCSTGECTALLARRLLLLQLQQRRSQNIDSIGSTDGRIVAFDTGSDVIERARNRVLSEFDNLMPKDSDGRVGEGEGRSAAKNDQHSQMVRYHKVDALADPRRARSHAVDGDDDASRREPDVVLVDIGGNRELRGVARMIRWVQSAFRDGPPRLIIVKSEALAGALSRSAGRSKEDGTESEGGANAAEEELSVTKNGIVRRAQEWFASLLSSSEVDADDGARCDSAGPNASAAASYSHPMKAPLVLSPVDDATPICRFHNYHPDGCRRHNDHGKGCPYDHEHCHRCRGAGHVASNCDGFDASPRLRETRCHSST